MPIPGPTTTLEAGQTVTVTSPIGPTSSQSWAVELDNISPWPLAVQAGGRAYVLAPGMAQLYSSNTGPALVTVTPEGPAASGNFYVLSNWAVSPDSIPGTFPVVVAPSLTGGIEVSGTVSVDGSTVGVENTPASALFSQDLATIVKQGQNLAPTSHSGLSWGWQIPLANIPSTTRSLLVILRANAGNVGNLTNPTVGGTGGTTGADWVPSLSIQAAGGGSTVAPGVTMTPAYFPWYGILDAAGTIEVGGNSTGNIDYWVVALPDADILGTDTTPTMVELIGSILGSPLGTPANPMAAALYDATGDGAALGTESNPIFITGGGLSAYGSGSDGPAIISVNTTLTRDMFYTTLTVNAGVTLKTGGFRIHATTSVTNNGTIDNSAGNSTATVVGAPGAPGSLGGGTAGKALTGSGAAAAGVAIVGTNLAGGPGGIGGGAAAAAAGSVPTNISNPETVFANYPITMAGGTSGGVQIATTATNGASGSGGGVVYLAAPLVNGTGTISANGGAGAVATAANGGAGGGGGGLVCIVSPSVTNQTIQVAGGASAGTFVSSGLGPTAGSAGNVVQIAA